MPRKPKTAPAEIVSIKGTDANMACRGFTFELGKTYTVEGKIEACANGWHACPVDQHPLSVFEYYPPAGNRYFVARQGGDTHAHGNKLASATITLDVELSIGDLVKRAVDWVMERAKKTDLQHNSGYGGAASNSGDYGAASNSGTRGAASNSGDYGAASNSGYGGCAMSHAYAGKVKCEGPNQVLYCTEINTAGHVVSAACGITGRDGVEAGVWYRCEAGKLVRA